VIDPASVPASGQGEADELDERTSLAWTRTSLALALAAVVVARLTVVRLGPVSVAAAVLGVLVAGWILVSSRQRFRAAHLALSENRHRPDARLPAALAGLVVVIALVELGALLR
jgi:uncharacterized membrane protein YidH (DUF202 family)